MKKLFELINRNVLNAKMGDFINTKNKVSKHPIITISREYGSGGSIVAKKILAKLGKDWKIYHEEIVDEIAKEAHLEKKLIREVDEKHIPIIEELTGEFFGKHYLTTQNYLKHLLKILSIIGLRGNAIIVGRGAHFIFPDALKVRVIADVEDRIKVVMKYDKVSEKKAKTIIDKKDKDRNEFNQTLFRHNQHKAHHYDVVIKISDNLSLYDAAKLILSLAKSRFKS